MRPTMGRNSRKINLNHIFLACTPSFHTKLCHNIDHNILILPLQRIIVFCHSYHDFFEFEVSSRSARKAAMALARWFLSPPRRPLRPTLKLVSVLPRGPLLGSCIESFHLIFFLQDMGVSKIILF